MGGRNVSNRKTQTPAGIAEQLARDDLRTQEATIRGARRAVRVLRAWLSAIKDPDFRAMWLAAWGAGLTEPVRAGMRDRLIELGHESMAAQVIDFVDDQLVPF